MLHTRSLLPLVSTWTPQWRLHALLRLPVELRQLVTRDFSSAADVQVDDGDERTQTTARGYGAVHRRITSRSAPPTKEHARASRSVFNRGKLRKTTTTYPDKTIPRRRRPDAFEPFQEQQVDPLAGFGLRLTRPDTSTYRLPMKDRLEIALEEEGTSLRRRQSGTTTRRFQLRKTGDSPSVAATAATITVRKVKHVLDKWRTPDELAEYHRLETAHLAMPLESRHLSGKDLRLSMVALNKEARARRGKAAGGMDELEIAILAQLQQTPQPKMIVKPDGSVTTVEEEKERARLDRLMPRTKTRYDPGLIDAELQRAREERSALDRKATLRGRILRKRAATPHRNGQSVTQRLALLNTTLRDSPGQVANAPAMQAQLIQLGKDLKRSLTSVVPTDYDSRRSASFNTTQPVGINGGSARKPKLSHPDEHKARETQYSQSQLALQQYLSPPASVESTNEAVSQDIVARPEDVSMFADLRAQIQELSSLVKVLVSQQAASQTDTSATQTMSQVIDNANHKVDAATNSRVTSTANQSHATSTGRYQAKLRNPPQSARIMGDFAALPHEIGEEIGKPLRSEDEERTDFQSPPAGSQALDATPVQTQASDSQPSATLFPGASSDQLGSLYEQLFPEEAAPLPTKNRAPSTVPRLSIPQDPQPSSAPQQSSKADLSDRQEAKRTVLVLRSASKTLTDEDFRRALPRGKHIQEWTKRGEYTSIIPMRDFWTLERTGDYFIIFQHGKVADAFMAHVKRLHELSRKHTPSTFSLLSELPPAPKGLLKDGYEDEAALVQNFTLVAPSMSLHLERLSKGIKAEVLAKGAYPQALAGNLTPETPQVLLEMDGGIMPNWFQIRDAVARDGLKRGLPWNLIPGDLGLRRLAIKPSTPSSSGSTFENDGDGHDEQGTGQVQDRLQKGANGQRWIVAFKDREEAQRFARGWHMRRFPWAEPEMKRDRVYKGSTRVKAEVLW